MFERVHKYDAFFLPGPNEIPRDEAVGQGLRWLLQQPGTPLVALAAKKVLANNRTLAAAVAQLRLSVVAPPHMWLAGWPGGAVLAPWASARVLAAIDDDLGDLVSAVCVIGWSRGAHDTWIRGHNARDLRTGSPLAEIELDPVVAAAMRNASRAINHNNALVQAEDKAYVVRTLQLLVRAGYRYDVETLCAWAIADGWTATEVQNLRDYAQRVLDGRRFQLRDSYGPGRDAVDHWRDEAAQYPR